MSKPAEQPKPVTDQYPCDWCGKPITIYEDELPGFIGAYCSIECKLERAREINLR